MAIAITLSWVFLTRVPVNDPHLTSDPAEAAAFARQQALFGGIACALLLTAFAVGFASPVASVVLTARLPRINIFFYRRAQQVPSNRDNDNAQ